MDKKIIILVFIIVLIIVTFFISSSYLSDTAIIDKTNVVIENASIQNLTLSYCIIKLKVKISNPTSEHISDLTADFDVFISDTDVGDGVVSKLSIPARSNEISDVYVTIYYSSVGSAVINVLQTGNFDLTIKGEAKASILFNILTIKKPFTSSYSVT